MPATNVVAEISTEVANMTALLKGTSVIAAGGDEEVGSVGLYKSIHKACVKNGFNKGQIWLKSHEP